MPFLDSFLMMTQARCGGSCPRSGSTSFTAAETDSIREGHRLHTWNGRTAWAHILERYRFQNGRTARHLMAKWKSMQA